MFCSRAKRIKNIFNFNSRHITEALVNVWLGDSVRVNPAGLRFVGNMATVDVEDESILASIFKDSFPESWRDNPDFAAYLSELSSFGVEKLTREPERLVEERAQILQQTRELAFSNYQTFIRTADCTELIYRDFGRVESSVSRLLDKLPGFGERCRSVKIEAVFGLCCKVL